MTLRRRRLGYLPTLLQRVDRAAMRNGGPICQTCLKPVDSEEWVGGYARDANGNTTQYDYAEVLYRCHGAEELVRFNMGSTDWTSDDLQRAVQRTRIFDPNGHLGN